MESLEVKQHWENIYTMKVENEFSWFQEYPKTSVEFSVATVIPGGLISSTLLDMIVTSVVFKKFGKKALDKYIETYNKDHFRDSDQAH